MEDTERPGASQKGEDDKIHTIVDENPRQIQQQLTNEIGFIRQPVSIRLQAMVKIRKLGKLVLHSLIESQKNGVSTSAILCSFNSRGRVSYGKSSWVT